MLLEGIQTEFLNKKKFLTKKVQCGTDIINAAARL